MESRAKQRLTGAIILVALFVLLVPELLTGPRDARPDAQAPDDEGLRRYTIELDAQRAAPNPMAPAPETAVALPPVATPMGETPQPATDVAAAEPRAASAVPATNPMAPVPAPSAARTEPAHVEPARPTTPGRAAEPGTFVVQLGTFSKRDNADRLVRDMTARGFAAFVVPITTNGHELYRVRVGPTRDRAAAEALAAQLKRVGQDGSIVPIS
jgi:DedD protein